MKVVFLADVEGSGRLGDVKDVAEGFARNYLLPRKLAAVASPDAVRRAGARAAAEARQQAQLDEEARALVESLGVATITIQARAGERGRLYGSVTAADIAEEVTRVTGSELDRHLVQLAEPIKELGSYAVPLKLSRNVVANLEVEVVSTEGKTAADFAAGAAEERPAESAPEAESSAEPGAAEESTEEVTAEEEQ